MHITEAMERAFELAKSVEGRTAPNPPVGALVLGENGEVLAEAAHMGAGQPHAEQIILQECADKNLTPHTMVVTLEPCSHQGRTPPCAEAIINAGIKRVVYGIKDINPEASGGHQKLVDAGIEVIDGIMADEISALMRPFFKWVKTGTPYITIKRAFLNGSMEPPEGQKTFTSEKSLDLAHNLRRRTDAIITGSGTILSDNPKFTVRRVPDHEDRDRRQLVFIDRRQRVPQCWIDQTTPNFIVYRAESATDALTYLGNRGCLHVLVEAGESLSTSMINNGLWDEIVDIHARETGEDLVSYKSK